MRYNGVIECNYISESDLWFADVTLISNLLSLDDLCPIQYYFACYEDGCLRINEDKIEIGPTVSEDYLSSICHQFSIYLKSLIDLKADFGEHPIYWTLDQIMTWRELSEKRIYSEGI